MAEFYIELTGRTGQPSRVGPFAAMSEVRYHLDTNHPDGVKGDLRIVRVVEEEVPVDFDDTEHETVDYGSYSKDELVEMCRERDLPVSGSKSDLIERLEFADEADRGPDNNAPNDEE